MNNLFFRFPFLKRGIPNQGKLVCFWTPLGRICSSVGFRNKTLFFVHKTSKTPEGRHATFGCCICMCSYIVKNAKKYLWWGSNLLLLAWQASVTRSVTGAWQSVTRARFPVGLFWAILRIWFLRQSTQLIELRRSPEFGPSTTDVHGPSYGAWQERDTHDTAGRTPISRLS